MDDSGFSETSAGEGAAKTTVDFYEVHAQEYFDRTVLADLESLYEQVFRFVRPGGRILDLGAGSGRDLKAMLDRGFRPLGIDASPALAKLATEFSGVPCLNMELQDLRSEGEFDAVWAFASLLHLPKRDLPSALEQLHKILSQDGILFVSVQVGDGEKLLPDGRFFSYYAPAELNQKIEDAGFLIEQTWLSKDSLTSRRTIEWLNVIGRRKQCNMTSWLSS